MFSNNTPFPAVSPFDDDISFATVTDDDFSQSSDSLSIETFSQPQHLTTTANAHGWTEHDVPIGRSQDVHNHIGNIRYRSLIDEHGAAYLAAERRADKALISIKIHNIVTRNGGRFLDKSKTVKGQWEEIPQDKALSKISQALRMNTRRRRNARPAAEAAKPETSSSNPFVLPSLESMVMQQKVNFSIAIPERSPSLTLSTVSDDCEPTMAFPEDDFEPLPLTELQRQPHVDPEFTEFSFSM